MVEGGGEGGTRAGSGLWSYIVKKALFDARIYQRFTLEVWTLRSGVRVW